MFRNASVQAIPNGYEEVLLDRIDGIRTQLANGLPDGNDAGEDGRDEFAIALNYTQPGFALGGTLEIIDRSSETPQVTQEPYKGPPPAKEGFTRTFGEDDILVCPMCGDELSTGKDDAKQQVWVIKQCGHVRILLTSWRDVRLTV